jgi:chromosome segregation protein
MSTARLRGLRLVGFKSFAERTDLEFGGGISAIVGPNGSGKSNLADALRWALGEQGRSLRTRRAEDVIFAGSSSRRAIGMADVALIIDNDDGLLPVDFTEVELGRRLYRSGENEYLLNRQRVRLRDLVDLLDSANLADNAFLFIGQGMVDQALALRPEERRPLFEEAAGIRRHERRRRLAEAGLAEAETNLERVRDVLAELRPQARRLAAQAEQQVARRSAGSDLAEALVEVARGRLAAALQGAATQEAALRAAHRDADEALAGLRQAEDEIARLSRDLAERAAAESLARTALDEARSRTVEWRLTGSRLEAEVQVVERDRLRLVAERESIELRAQASSREMALPVPARDGAEEEALRDVEAAIADGVRLVDELRDASSALGERAEAKRRDRNARLAERDRLAQRAERASAALLEQTERAGLAVARAEATAAEREAHVSAAGIARHEEARAEAISETARVELAAAEIGSREADVRLAEVQGRLEAARASIGVIDARLAAGSDVRMTRSARARGGRRLTEGLEVDAALRSAVEAALGDILAAVLVDAAVVPALSESASGTIVMREGGVRSRAGEGGRIENAASAAGGGRLVDALRRDPEGAVGLLLARVVWVPTLADALELRSVLAPGWRVTTRDGVLLTDEGVVRTGRAESFLERQEERAALMVEMEDLEAASAAETTARSDATDRRSAAAQALERAREALHEALRERRVAEERERAATRTAEAAAREAGWQTAQLERTVAESRSAAQALTALPDPDAMSSLAASPDGAKAPDAELDAAQERLRALRQRRDEAAASASSRLRVREAALERRRHAEISLAMDEARLLQVDDGIRQSVAAVADASRRSADAGTRLAAADTEEKGLAAALLDVLAGSGGERERLRAAESAAVDHRERLRTAEGRSRTAEVAEMEARMGADAVREQLLVELAGIGHEGLAALHAEAGASQPEESDPEALATALETALDAALASWRATDLGVRSDHAGPSASRLAGLRRRYHDLGASNPFAAAEFAEVRQRLEALDAQRADLEGAIGSTRELIVELSTLISSQFRATFAALEGAFARRFQQLFDGGEAQLSLTDPQDLSRTGVEITARPPGKKRQPLAMLSGGERALTAVALLMAMLEVRPVPFCVLDEVDAALDEANIGRFSAALRTLAERIQFIVITHNRGTIEAADALYGVTVDDDAVSRVTSLRLSDLDPAMVATAASPA